MAVCLDYQTVYARRDTIVIGVRMQVVIACIILCILGTKVWAKIEMTDLGYKLGRERSTAVAYDMERRELELQRSVLLRPDALAASAKKQLGLGELDPSQARAIVMR